MRNQRKVEEDLDQPSSLKVRNQRKVEEVLDQPSSLKVRNQRKVEEVLDQPSSVPLLSVPVHVLHTEGSHHATFTSR